MDAASVALPLVLRPFARPAGGTKRLQRSRSFNPNQFLSQRGCQQSQEQKRQEKLERDVEKLLRAMAKHPGGETKTVLRDGAGLSGGEINAALAAALDRGEAVAVEIVKGNRKTPIMAYKLPE